MEIKKAEMGQLDAVMEIYHTAQTYMAQHGNPSQWGTEYPSRELVAGDIAKGQLYTAVDEDGLEGVFVFFVGKEPNYENITEGAWLNEKPYGVLHRIASAGKKKGVASHCIRWCLSQWPNMRGDTHEKNEVMQHVMEKNGLKRCGTIFVEDGTERIAFQTP